MSGLRPGQNAMPHPREPMPPAPTSPAPTRRRATGCLIVLAKVLASFVLFLLCTVVVGDLCFPIHKRCPDSPSLRILVVAAHVLAGVAFVEGIRALWGRAVARIFCAVGFVWFLLLLTMVHADFVDSRVQGVFEAIFGILFLYCLVRFILLCRRPARRLAPPPSPPPPSPPAS